MIASLALPIRALILVCCLVLFGCSGAFNQSTGTLTGTTDQTVPLALNKGMVYFTLQKGWADTGENKLKVTLRDPQGSVVKVLFNLGEEGEHKATAELEKPGQHQLEIAGAKGSYTLTWGGPPEVPKPGAAPDEKTE